MFVSDRIMDLSSWWKKYRFVWLLTDLVVVITVAGQMDIGIKSENKYQSVVQLCRWVIDIFDEINQTWYFYSLIMIRLYQLLKKQSS